MTLPSSGALSYNSIRAEFGSPSSNVNLSLYVRGSQYTTYLSSNSNIPTSATAEIAVNDFYGAEGGANYAFGTGGSYNTGGKQALQYYGWGDSTGFLPAAQNTSIKIGSLTTTMSSFYHVVGGALASKMVLQMGSNTNQNSNLTSRTFTAYNTSASSLGSFTTSSIAGTSCTAGGGTFTEMPNSSGFYSQGSDDLNQGAPCAAGSTMTTNFPTPSNLNQYFYVKAF